MRKILLTLLLFVVALTANAQYSMLGADVSRGWSNQYITNSPTSTVGNRVNMMVLKDSTWWENRWEGVSWTKYTATRNNGLPTGLLWTDAAGMMKHSPMSEVRLPYSQITGTPVLFDGDYNSLTNKPTLFSGAYADLTGKPTLFSGSYNDLTNKPTIPAAQINADWNASSGLAAILNKPVLFSGAYADLTGKPNLFSGAYADLSGKPILFSGVYSDLSGKPSLFSGSYLDLTNRPTLFSGAYADLTGKPTLFSGSYTDLTNKPSIPNVTGDYTVTRAINSSTYTISTTRSAQVRYNIKITCTASIGSNSSGKVLFQYSTDAGTTWVDAGEVENSNTVTLAIALNATTVQSGFIVWNVPANALCRLVPTSVGTTTITWMRGQETY